MRLPNKVTPFKKSTLALFVPILEMLAKGDASPVLVYEKVKNKTDDISSFVDALDCLFALNKIVLLPSGVIRYVK